MEALKTALRDGCSTVLWSIVQKALEQQRTATAGTTNGAASPAPELEDGPRVHLESAALWRQFFSITNEMIVTKAGRRMFPVLKLHLSKLDPLATYAVILEFRCTHPHRWRFLNGNWQKGSSSEDNAEQRHVFVHFSCLAPGSQWMQEPVSFAKLKLSNRENGSSKIKLNSLHKYQPYIHLVKMTSNPAKQLQINSFTFEETQFIAVTAYQNDKVTQMKIKNNPFAKAFLGGNTSERAHNCTFASSIDALTHAYTSRLLPPVLPLPPHPLPLGISPPPYPGSPSPLSHRYPLQPPAGGFQYPAPPIMNQEHTCSPPLMAHQHFVYNDYHGCIEVYEPEPSYTPPQTSCLYDYAGTTPSSSSAYFSPGFHPDYLTESPLLPCEAVDTGKQMTTVPSAESDECLYSGYHHSQS